MSDNAALLLSTLEDGVLTLTLNRPNRLNALTPALMRRLVDVLEVAATNPDVGVVTLTGAGNGFCSGGDMREGRRDTDFPDAHKKPGYDSPEQRADRLRRYAEASRLLREMHQPTIAMVRGAAAGAGLALALACDFRFAAPSAKFVPGYVASGFAGDYGVGFLLAAVVGRDKALELLLTNPKLAAEEARALGIITSLVAEDKLEGEVRELAKRLANGPRVAHRYIKANIQSAAKMSFADYLDRESMHMIRSMETEDAKEAIRAFSDRRSPVFKGL